MPQLPDIGSDDFAAYQRDNFLQNVAPQIASIAAPVASAVNGATSSISGTIQSIKQGVSQDFQQNVDKAVSAAQRYGLDPVAFARQINQESGFNPGAQSGVGAGGIAQFMPDTAKSLGIDRFNPDQALDAAAKWMSELKNQFGGDYQLALAAYNAGPGNVTKYGYKIFDPSYLQSQGWSASDANQPLDYIKAVMGTSPSDQRGAVAQSSGPSLPGVASAISDTAAKAGETFNDYAQRLIGGLGGPSAPSTPPTPDFQTHAKTLISSISGQPTQLPNQPTQGGMDVTAAMPSSIQLGPLGSGASDTGATSAPTASPGSSLPVGVTTDRPISNVLGLPQPQATSSTVDTAPAPGPLTPASLQPTRDFTGGAIPQQGFVLSPHDLSAPIASGVQSAIQNPIGAAGDVLNAGMGVLNQPQRVVNALIQPDFNQGGTSSPYARIADYWTNHTDPKANPAQRVAQLLDYTDHLNDPAVAALIKSDPSGGALSTLMLVGYSLATNPMTFTGGAPEADAAIAANGGLDVAKAASAGQAALHVLPNAGPAIGALGGAGYAKATGANPQQTAQDVMSGANIGGIAGMVAHPALNVARGLGQVASDLAPTAGKVALQALRAPYDLGVGAGLSVRPTGEPEGQISWESLPGKTAPILPGVHGAPWDQQVEFHQAIRNVFVAPDGGDILLQAEGLGHGTTFDTMGVYHGVVSPGAQVLVDVTWVGNQVDPAQRPKLMNDAILRGIIVKQDESPWTATKPAPSFEEGNAVGLALGRELDLNETRGLNLALTEALGPDKSAVVGTTDGAVILNFSGKPTPDFADVVSQAAGGVKWSDNRDLAVIPLTADGGIKGNNWTEAPNGEQYRQAISDTPGSAGLQGIVEDLSRRVEAVYRNFAAKYGWDQPPAPDHVTADESPGPTDARSNASTLSSAQRVGSPETVQERATKLGKNGLPLGSDFVHEGAARYVREAGVARHIPNTPYVRNDVAAQTEIARLYDQAIHNPRDPAVARSYAAFAKEVSDQYDFATKPVAEGGMGMTFEPWTKDGQPYANSTEMRTDVAMNHHLYFFTGGDMPEDHPLLQVDPRSGLSINDKFRAVHDLFGHSSMGFDFGPRGEENAWREHAKMFSDEARQAMSTETRGQNSWVNYGPHGEANQADKANTVYADQKAMLLPRWATDPYAHPDMAGGAPIEITRRQRGGLATPDIYRSAQDLGKKPGSDIEYQFEQAANRSADESADHLSHLTAAQMKAIDPVTGKNAGNPPSMDDLRKAIKLGWAYKNWYYDFADYIHNAIGGKNLKEATSLFGITSQQTSPAPNIERTLAIMRYVRELDAGGKFPKDPDDLAKKVFAFAQAQKSGPDGGWNFTQVQAEKVAKLYFEGPVHIVTNAKTSSYAGHFQNIFNGLYDPNTTADTWMGQLFGYPNGAISDNNPMYRFVNAITARLAREEGVPPHEVQAAGWVVGRTLATDPAANALMQKGKLGEAIDLGQSKGLFNNLPGTLDEVHNYPPAAKQSALYQSYRDMPTPGPAGNDAMRLYFPGTAAKPDAQGIRKLIASNVQYPVGTGIDDARRVEALEKAPQVSVPLGKATLQAVGYDPKTQDLPWLYLANHVTTDGQHLVVSLPNGNIETARYVASLIGRPLGQDSLIHLPASSAKEVGGVVASDLTAAEKAAFGKALNRVAVPYTISRDGMILVPNLDQSTEWADNLASALKESGIAPGRVASYRGDYEQVERGRYAGISQTLGDKFRSPARSSSLQERALSDIQSQAQSERADTREGGASLPASSEVGSHPGALDIARGGTSAAGFAMAAAPQQPGESNEDYQRRVRLGQGLTGLGMIGGLISHSSNPHTQTLMDMLDRPPGPPDSTASAGEQMRQQFVRAWTDSRGDLGDLQARALAAAGRALGPDEMPYQLAGMNPTLTAQIGIQRDLIPAIQSVGADRKLLSAALIHQDNIDVARAMNNPERSFSGGLKAAQSAQALLDMRQEIGPQRWQKLEAAASQIYAFNRQMLQKKVTAGLITADTYNHLVQLYPHYVRTEITEHLVDPNSIPVGKTLSSTDTGLRRNTVEGTELNREDPLVSTIRNAYETQALVNRNVTFNALINAVKLDPQGLAQVIKQVPSDFTDTRSSVGVTGYVDGVKQKWAMPKELETAIRFESASPLPQLNTVMTVLRGVMASRNPLFLPMHAKITVLPYLVRTMTREGGPTPSALTRSVSSLASAYIDAFHGLLSGSYSGDTARYLEGGGGMFGAFDPSVEGGRKSLEDLTRDNPWTIRNGGDVKRVIRDLLTLQPVEDLINRVDLAPRVAAMKMAEQRGANPVQSVYEGRSATIDFQKGGTMAKTLNQIIPFFNVGIQAGAQPVRAFRDNPRAFAMTAVATLAVPTVLIEAWNRSDPQRSRDYDDVPQYIKDRGLVMMLPNDSPSDANGNPHPQFIPIETREFSPFVMATREIMGRVLGRDPRGWADLIGHGLLSQTPIQGDTGSSVLGAASPPLLKEGLELAVNKDFYRNRPIQSKRADDNASPFDQTIAQGIDRVAPSVKPSQVGYVARALGGGIGSLAESASRAAQPATNDQVPQDRPLIGAMESRLVRGDNGQLLTNAQAATITPEAQQILRQAGIDYTPTPVLSAVRGIPITQSEELQYQNLVNQRVDRLVHTLATKPAWTNLPVDQKQRILSDNIAKIHAETGDQILQTIPRDDLHRRAVSSKQAAQQLAANNAQRVTSLAGGSVAQPTPVGSR